MKKSNPNETLPDDQPKELQTIDSDKPPAPEEGKEKEPDEEGPAEDQNKTLSLRGVVLRGPVNMRTGKHTAHISPTLIVKFTDGEANVSEDVETILREAGVIE